MITIERLLSFSAIEGLHIIEKYSKRQPNLDQVELIELIRKLDSDGKNMDLEAALELRSLVDTGNLSSQQDVYRECIRCAVISRNPNWIKLMMQGRMKMLRGLSLDEHETFRRAGLLADVPDLMAVGWWDELAAHSRALDNSSKMKRARRAELLSLDYEKSELIAFGIVKEPTWPGLDNNFAGYDVLSYRLGKYGIDNLLIEVKSTIASPLRFYLTRHEWEKAVQSGDAYIFHIWDLANQHPILYILNAQDIANQIPKDKENGKWKLAEILLGGSKHGIQYEMRHYNSDYGQALN